MGISFNINNISKAKPQILRQSSPTVAHVVKRIALYFDRYSDEVREPIDGGFIIRRLEDCNAHPELRVTGLPYDVSAMVVFRSAINCPDGAIPALNRLVYVLNQRGDPTKFLLDLESKLFELRRRYTISDLSTDYFSDVFADLVDLYERTIELMDRSIHGESVDEALETFRFW